MSRKRRPSPSTTPSDVNNCCLRLRRRFVSGRRRNSTYCFRFVLELPSKVLAVGIAASSTVHQRPRAVVQSPGVVQMELLLQTTQGRPDVSLGTLGYSALVDRKYRTATLTSASRQRTALEISVLVQIDLEKQHILVAKKTGNAFAIPYFRYYMKPYSPLKRQKSMQQKAKCKMRYGITQDIMACKYSPQSTINRLLGRYPKSGNMFEN